MKNTPLSLILVLACGAIALPAFAEKADRNKTMNIEADSMRIDDVKQVRLISGNVVLTKGTIVIRAANVEVREDPDGYQYAMITGTPSKPAFYRQKREGLDEFIEGESELIEYDGRADTVRFLRKAQFRRLRGATLADEITGAVIVYENLTDTFRVDGNAVKGAAGAPGGRVRAMLTPKPEPTASAPQNKLPPQPSPSLRPTNSLGSPPQ